MWCDNMVKVGQSGGQVWSKKMTVEELGSKVDSPGVGGESW